MVKVAKSHCLHLTGPNPYPQCGHPEWRLTSGRLWLTCKTVSEIRNGCPAKSAGEREKK